MLIARKRIWRDRFATIRGFYKSPKFVLIDLTFGIVALFVNPYRVCRKFLQKKGMGEVYAYGETPILTYQRLVEQCGIGPEDTWIEMGSGRGKGCFWLSHFVGCKVVGIEWIPSFVFVGRVIGWMFGMKRVRFECKNMEGADLREATVVYLYGNWPQIEIPHGVKVITVSEPLENGKVLKTFWVRYPWGRTTAFLQVRD